MKVLVGLGNPGDKYSKSRHNIGFRVISRLADEYNIAANQLRYHSLLGTGFIAGEKVVLVQPITYMNKSGKAVKAIANNYDISLSDLFIIYDDLDLPPGKIRIKNGGSSGGHNGLKSIINHLNCSDFSRIRIGIGRPPENVDVADYVLDYFSNEDEKTIKKAIDDVIGAVELLINENLEKTMNEYN